MNPTRIEWCHCFGPGSGFTWNPVVGCSFNCKDPQGKPYCYARRQAKRQKQNCQQCYDFTPHLHPERLEQPLHRVKPAGIFLGSMTDLYGPEVPQEWRDQVWVACRETPQHQYFVLTKQPQNVRDLQRVPNNVLWGFSCHDEQTYRERSRLLADVPYSAGPLMVSFEPLLGPLVGNLFLLGKFSWLIVGAQTGSKPFTPPGEWVDEIIGEARYQGCRVFIKNNLRALYPDRDWPQEWPGRLAE